MTMQKTIGYCGVDCAVCADFAHRKCPGCRDSVWPENDPCPPVGCCREKGFSCCGECPDFACEMMQGFYEESDSHRAAGERMKQFRQIAPEEPVDRAKPVEHPHTSNPGVLDAHNREMTGKHPKKRVILLNGPSSSGKSTLSRALKSLMKETSGEEYGIVSIDDFLRCSRDETVYEEDVFEIGGKLCESLRKLLDSRPGVIVDHVITSQRIFAQFKEAVRDYEVWTVHVTCPLRTLMAREKERGNRCPGSAEASYRYLYPRDGYDVTVDTGVLQPEEAAALICQELRSLK